MERLVGEGGIWPGVGRVEYGGNGEERGGEDEGG